MEKDRGEKIQVHKHTEEGKIYLHTSERSDCGLRVRGEGGLINRELDALGWAFPSSDGC